MANFVNERALEFIRRNSATEDGVLASLHGEYARRELPNITPEAGHFLQVLMLAIGAKRVLEIGTCLGYSTVWMARGLPDDGKIQTIELDRDRAAEAREWFEKAGLSDKIEVMAGKALGVLPTLPTKRYDAVFIDADKETMPTYLDFAVRLLRHGGVVLADNVFWHGSTFDKNTNIEGAAEVREFVSTALEHPDLETSILPLGDGLMVAYRR